MSRLILLHRTIIKQRMSQVYMTGIRLAAGHSMLVRAFEHVEGREGEKLWSLGTLGPHLYVLDKKVAEKSGGSEDAQSLNPELMRGPMDPAYSFIPVIALKNIECCCAICVRKTKTKICTMKEIGASTRRLYTPHPPSPSSSAI